MLEDKCMPSVRGEIKKARNSGYDVQSAIFEFIDNAFDTNCTTVKIFIKEKFEHGVKYLNKIIISDNNDWGISKEKLHDIFSWTYERERKNNDIGEYGTGFKSASVNLGNTINVYTYDQKYDKYWKAIADWDEMEETNRWHPKILEINKDFFNDYHPFDKGTSFIIENLRYEFFQNQKNQYSLIQKLYDEISYYYKYYLKQFSNKTIIVKGYFDNDEKIIEKHLSFQDPSHFFYFFQKTEDILESKILIYKDQAHFLNFFIHKKNNPKIEIVEFVEKRKNGNSICKCSEISSRILASMYLMDEIIFRSCHYLSEKSNDEIIQSFGSVDIIHNYRIMGRDINFRKPRHDPLATFIKHEILFNSKKLYPLMGVQFNKKSNILDNDLNYSLEYLQSYHERELIRLCNKTHVENIPKETCKEVQDFNDALENSSILNLDTIVIVNSNNAKNQTTPSIETNEIELNEKNKRKNFSLETKLQIIKKQECRDSDFDFLLKDDVLPLDYDHKIDRTNNSEENCQALSVISHAIKSRRPQTYHKIVQNKESYIIQLLNCLTSSKYFLNLYKAQKISILPVTEITGSVGIFKLNE